MHHNINYYYKSDLILGHTLITIMCEYIFCPRAVGGYCTQHYIILPCLGHINCNIGGILVWLHNVLFSGHFHGYYN